jgi:hypothetical protein
VSIRPEGRAPFYVVTAGGCLLEVDGEPAPRTLAAGDLALLPRAHAHVLRSSAEAPAVSFGRFVKEHPMDERGFVRCDGGQGPTSTLVGGFFLSEELEATPLLAALPPVVHLRADDQQVASWLPSTLRFIGVEMGSGLHGSRSVLNRLADILFIQAVRVFLSTGEPIHPGWLKGLSDGQVARAGADSPALRQAVESRGARQGDRCVPDRPGGALPHARRRLADGLPHAMANAPGRAAAARVARDDGGGRREGRLHVRGRLRESVQADARADARRGSAVGPAALSDRPGPQARAGVSMSLRLSR